MCWVEGLLRYLSRYVLCCVESLLRYLSSYILCSKSEIRVLLGQMLDIFGVRMQTIMMYFSPIAITAIFIQPSLHLFFFFFVAWQLLLLFWFFFWFTNQQSIDPQTTHNKTAQLLLFLAADSISSSFYSFIFKSHLHVFLGVPLFLLPWQVPEKGHSSVIINRFSPSVSCPAAIVFSSMLVWLTCV